MSEDPTRSIGIISIDQMRKVVRGMTISQVLNLVGEPLRRLPPGTVKTPSDVFAEVGSSLRFDSDQRLSEIWCYEHDRRGKFKLARKVTTFLGFEDGVLKGYWQTFHHQHTNPPDHR